MRTSMDDAGSGSATNPGVNAGVVTVSGAISHGAEEPRFGELFFIGFLPFGPMGEIWLPAIDPGAARVFDATYRWTAGTDSQAGVQMNAIIQTLLAGTAFGALATAPAMAEDIPPFHVAALHPGHATLVSKTSMHKGPVMHAVSNTTIAISTSDTAGLRKVVKLAATYYTFYDSGSFCNSTEKQRVKLAKKKTQYAKLGTSTETYSGYCSTAPTVFYGDTYELTKKAGEGKEDEFRSTLVGKKIHYNGGLYDIDVPMWVTVSIGQ